VPGDPQQDFALGERLGDQPEFELLEVAQSAVDELGGGAGGGCREVYQVVEKSPERCA
jgi:hypothetical protein